MSKVYVLTDYYTYGYNYSGGALYSSSLSYGTKYYVTSRGDDIMSQDVLLGSFTYTSEMSSVSVGGLWFDFGDGYCYFESDDAGSRYISVYYDDENSSGGSSSNNIGTVSLNNDGLAYWSINNNLTIYSMYLWLWDEYDYVGDSVWIDTMSSYAGTYDFSNRIMSNGYNRSYYVTLQIDYYDYTTDISGNTTLRSQSIYFSSSTGSSINKLMRNIADAVRSKASVYGSLGIRSMITTLNNLSTTGSTDNSSYNSNDFDSCMKKLANVIRAKGNTYNTLTLAEMPSAINAITLAPTNPLDLSVYLRSQEYPTSPGDIRVEISSNAYMYSGSYAIVTWYSNDIASSGIRNTNLDGGIVYCNASVTEGNNYIYASVTVYATINGVNYSKTERTDTIMISNGGESSGWDHNTLWYYNNDWYDYCPSESITWYSTTCSKCGATIHTESACRGENCKNTKNGEYCNEYVYWSETDTPLYRCHAYLGEGMTCDRTGYSYDEGCPEHGTAYWYQD